MTKYKQVTNEQKKEILWYLIDAYDKAHYACGECYDIDCNKSIVYGYLKKKHQIDVIDHKRCIKQQKAHADKILKLIMLPMFKKARQRKCDKCGKMAEFEKYGLDLKPMKKNKCTMIAVCERCRK